jgi:hypothetical protein
MPYAKTHARQLEISLTRAPAHQIDDQIDCAIHAGNDREPRRSKALSKLRYASEAVVIP